MKNGVRAIIFDVGGVLSLGKNSKWKNGKLVPSGVHEDIAKKLKITLDQYLDSIDTVYAKSIEGNIPFKKSLSIISKNLRTSEENIKKLYLWAYRKHFKQNNQLFKQAFKLKRLGYKIAIISDQWYLSRLALMSSKYYNKFDEIIVSYKVKMRKPSKEIYLLALRKLKLHPQDVLFIDNQKWNISPAKKLGMNTILFKSNKQLFKNPVWKRLFEK